MAASPTWTAVDSRNVVRTGLRRTVSEADIQRWAEALADAVACIPDGTTFALVADLTFYQPDRLATHRTIREVVPRLLTRHGMRDVHFDLFPGGPEPRLRQERGVSCDTYANVTPPTPNHWKQSANGVSPASTRPRHGSPSAIQQPARPT